MSGRKAAQYLAAKEDYEALMRQREQYPELKDSPQHCRALTEARAAMLTIFRTMTGSELGQARRLEAAKKKETPSAEG
jgi:hypothetical protein